MRLVLVPLPLAATLCALLLAPGAAAQGDGHFDWPVNVTRSSQNFGNLDGPQVGTVYTCGRAHAGVDFAGETDTIVRAVADGEVVCTQYDTDPSPDPNSNGYPGRVVVVRHRLPDGRTVYSMYAHMDFCPQPGASCVANHAAVRRGEQIGSLYEQPSNTHLHFEVREFPFWDLTAKAPSQVEEVPDHTVVCSGRGYAEESSPAVGGDRNGTPYDLDGGYLNPIDFIFARLPPLSNALAGTLTPRDAPSSSAPELPSVTGPTPKGPVRDAAFTCPGLASGGDWACNGSEAVCPSDLNGVNRLVECERRTAQDCSAGACDWWYELPLGAGQTGYVKAFTKGPRNADLLLTTPYTAQPLPAWQDPAPESPARLVFAEENVQGRVVPNVGTAGSELDGNVWGALLFDRYVPNFPDRTLLFDGTSTYVQLRNSTRLKLGDGFSFRVSVRRDSEETDDHVVGQWGSTTASQVWLVSFVNAGGALADNRRELQFKLRPAGGTPVVARYVLPDCEYLREWSQLAGRYDPAAGVIELYWRNRLVARESVPGAPASSTAFLTLGGAAWFGAQSTLRFDGAMDTFRLWGTLDEPPTCLEAGGVCTPRPDLQPLAIAPPSATTLYEGQSLTFTSAVGNNGPENAPAFGVRWRVDGVDLASALHLPVPSFTSVSDPAADVFTWTAVAGEHVIEFVVDPADTVDESVETNNVVPQRVIVSATARPDLVPAGLTHRACDLASGESVRFDTSVRNDGDVGSTGFQVQWRVDGDEAGPARAYPGVPAGGSLDDPAATFDWLAVAGTHTLEFSVDTGNQVVEANEANNVRRVTVVVPDALRADLRPTAVKLLGTPTPGATVTFDSGVRNLGRAGSGIFNVRWLVDNQDAGAAGSHADVPAGATVLDDNSSFSWTVLPGAHTITFEVDYDRQVDECNESDNRLARTVDGAPSAVDLLPPAAPKLVSGQLFAGNPVVIDAAVRNAGSAPSEEFVVHWLVDDQVRRAGLHGPLPGGATVSDGNSQFVWLVQPGRHVLGFLVDADNRIDETRADNNLKTLTLDVPFERPDLKPTAIKPVPSTGLFAGNAITFDAGVQNLGPADSGDFNVRWLMDGVPVGEGLHGGVPAGATVLNDNSQLPFTLTAGAHAVTFIVDSGQHVAELSESNNVVQLPFTVSDLPRADLRPTTIKAVPAAPSPGQAVQLDSGVRNTGVAASAPFNVRWQIDGVTLGEGSHVGVPAGATVLNDNSQLGWTATGGSHVITFTVDSGNHVLELSESNNSLTLPLTVAGVPDEVLGPFPVSAQANIFGAGGSTGPYGGGAPPALVVLPPGSGRVLTFSVTGAALSCCGTALPHDADGGPGLQTYILSSTSPISGVRHHSRNIFLLGVLLDDAAPAGPAPGALRYYDPTEGGPVAGAASSQAATSSSALRQSFYVGDGRGAAGVVQRIAIPDSATRLFLGFADGLNLGDPTLGTPSPAEPGFYGDNTGLVSVTVTVTR